MTEDDFQQLILEEPEPETDAPADGKAPMTSDSAPGAQPVVGTGSED